MIPRIKELHTLDNYFLDVTFDDGKKVIYDVKTDMNECPRYIDLKNIFGLFDNANLDKSRTCVYWNDYIDLPSDAIYEFGVEKNT